MSIDQDALAKLIFSMTESGSRSALIGLPTTITASNLSSDVSPKHSVEAQGVARIYANADYLVDASKKSQIELVNESGELKIMLEGPTDVQSRLFFYFHGYSSNSPEFEWKIFWGDQMVPFGEGEARKDLGWTRPRPPEPDEYLRFYFASSQFTDAAKLNLPIQVVLSYKKPSNLNPGDVFVIQKCVASYFVVT